MQFFHFIFSLHHAYIFYNNFLLSGYLKFLIIFNNYFNLFVNLTKFIHRIENLNGITRFIILINDSYKYKINHLLLLRNNFR